MMFCGKCGSTIASDMKYCAFCGMEAKKEDSRRGQQSEMPTTHENDEDNTKLMSILAYIIFFIPLIVGAHKKSEFVRYHTNQGTILFLATLIWVVALIVLSFILMNIPYIGWIISTLISLFKLGPIIFTVLGIMHVANEEMKPLPIIGAFTIVK